MKKLWIAFTAVVLLSFAVLGWAGLRIYQEKPPIPDQVVAADGTVMIDHGQITAGQNVWQAMGGMQVGSIWGHGSYVAPDWTADWLHRECVFILNDWANADFALAYDQLDLEKQAALQARLKILMRTNTHNPATNTITVDPVRVRAFESNLAHYSDVFANGHEQYAIPKGAVSDPVKLRQMASFFFWTSWAASTNRPNEEMSYTSNWPHEALVDNVPTSDAVIYTGMSIIMLLAGIGMLVWYHAAQKKEPVAEKLPEQDPMFGFQPTPSQKAVIKYFWVVSGLFLLQMIMGKKLKINKI